MHEFSYARVKKYDGIPRLHPKKSYNELRRWPSSPPSLPLFVSQISQTAPALPFLPALGSQRIISLNF